LQQNACGDGLMRLNRQARLTTPITHVIIHSITFVNGKVMEDAPRIAISQDEITADLNYRGGELRRAGSVTSTHRGRR